MPTIPRPEPTTPDANWWRDDRFGMFIHWGLYSAFEGEWEGRNNKPSSWGFDCWIQLFADIPAADYRNAARSFTPDGFNAEEIVLLAKAAGQRYLIVTAKHHDGFCMFDSDFTDFTITKATPFDRDPVAELRDACERHSIDFGVYYSLPDWHEKTMPQEMSTYRYHSQPDSSASVEKYREFMIGQLKELVGKYRAKILWFDDGDFDVFKPEGRDRSDVLGTTDLIAQLREINPQLLVNNRAGLGDFSTPEQHIPDQPGDRLFEACMTIGKAWGYISYDEPKPAHVFTRNLSDLSHKGGNYLLNISPKPTGEVADWQRETLEEIGAWMDTCAPAIHASKPSPWPGIPEWGRITTNSDGSTIYLHVFEQPAIGFAILPGMTTIPARITLLNDPDNTPDMFPRTLKGDLWLHLPEQISRGSLAPEHPAVFALEFEQAPAITVQQTS